VLTGLLTSEGRIHDDGILVFLGHQDGAYMGIVQGVDEHLVGEDVQFLLGVSSDVFGARQSICG
jgi:hypothetical protein